MHPVAGRFLIFSAARKNIFIRSLEGATFGVTVVANMKKLATLLHSNIVSVFVFLGLTCGTAFSRPSSSPVGTWEVTITRPNSSPLEKGTVFLTFSNDNTFTAYGMTTGTFTVFKWSGTWNVNASGKLVADYIENIFDAQLDGHFEGRALNGKRLHLKVAGLDGRFDINGKPADGIPDFGGSWNGTLRHSIGQPPIEGGDPKPPMLTTETFQFTPSNEFPGVFDLVGNGSGPEGTFGVTGVAILNSKGKITAFTFNDLNSGGEILVGRFIRRKDQTVLHGRDGAGAEVHARLRRTSFH